MKKSDYHIRYYGNPLRFDLEKIHCNLKEIPWYNIALSTPLQKFYLIFFYDT